MKVFISWAGEESKHMATTLLTWLPQVIFTLEPWMSTRIKKGETWDGAIAKELHESPIGIFCLTAESLESKYLHYEAGAIANNIGSHSCTLLLGITDLDVKHPLARFQHTKFTKDDMLILLQTINAKMHEAGETPIADKVLSKSLDQNWPDLLAASKVLPMAIASSSSRTDKELLEEILETVRAISSKEKESLLNENHQKILDDHYQKLSMVKQIIADSIQAGKPYQESDVQTLYDRVSFVMPTKKFTIPEVKLLVGKAFIDLKNRPFVAYP